MNFKPPFSDVNEFVNILRTRELNYSSKVVVHAPVVSIISSFYNDQKYFEDAYKSIINQTFQNYEWILVDDCSTDIESIDLFNSLTQKNAKIRTFHHLENKGPASGRNKAATHARGKYLFFMDTDDLIEPTYIEKCLLFLETHPEFTLVNSYSVGFQEEEYWWDKGFNTPSKFIKENLVTGRVLYRKKDFDQLGGYDENMRYGEDWDLWLKAITNNQKAYTIPEYLDCYRRRKTGLLGSTRQKKQLVEQTENLLHARYQYFFDSNILPDNSLELSSFDVGKLAEEIRIDNPLNYNAQAKHILCFLPDLNSGEANEFMLKLFQELQHKGYELTLVTTLSTEHNWYAKFYQITPDIFNLSNLFSCSHWLDFTKYIIESRKIDHVFISNNIYAYYLLPLLRQELSTLSFISFIHAKETELEQECFNLSCKMSDLIDCQIVTSQKLLEYYTDSKNQIYFININKIQDNLDTIFDTDIENILKESIQSRSTNQNINELIYGETFAWIQKSLNFRELTVKYNTLLQKLDEIKKWSRQIKKERDIYNNQSQAWIKVAKLNQLDLEKLKLELAVLQEENARLKSKHKREGFDNK
jgi:glycosyltransferase involved in cell wall biosynthesis